MGRLEKTGYVKRTQKDYSLSFKLQVVQEVEDGEISITSVARKYGIQATSTVSSWLEKYGNLDWNNKLPFNMPKTPEQKLMELEQKVRLLEKKNTTLKNQAEFATNKAIIFDMMIDLAEKEYKIKIRKNSEPK